MKLIVGLGNPGRHYARSRHNVGFRCLSHLARLHSIRLDRKQCRARTGAGRIGNEDALLAKPVTFMNASGASVACLMRKHGLHVGDLLVIYDDLDLPTGKIRVRPGGGPGGHKGMNSIIEALGSNQFARVRVGIGRPRTEERAAGKDIVVGHVLSYFSPQEERLITPAVDGVAQAVECLLLEGVETAMTRFN